MGNKVGGNLQQKMTMGGGRFMDSQIPEEIIPEEVENEDWEDQLAATIRGTTRF